VEQTEVAAAPGGVVAGEHAPKENESLARAGAGVAAGVTRSAVRPPDTPWAALGKGTIGVADSTHEFGIEAAVVATGWLGVANLKDSRPVVMRSFAHTTHRRHARQPPANHPPCLLLSKEGRTN
jgi:hypothetical protein